MVGAKRALQRDGFGLKFSGSSELNRSERGFKKGVQDRLGASIWIPSRAMTCQVWGVARLSTPADFSAFLKKAR